MKLNLQ